jgi:RNA polymerase sigma-70 factor (ECF subfamily)
VDGRGETELAGLLDAADAGDKRAYREFLRLAGRLVSQFIHRRVDGRGGIDVDDITQDVLLAIHLKRHTRRRDMPVTPWLYAVARYKLIDALRRRGRQREIAMDNLPEVPAEPQKESLTDREIDNALKDLSPGQRSVVAALSVQGLTIRDAANDLGMKESAVRVAWHRGLAAIAVRLGRRP